MSEHPSNDIRANLELFFKPPVVMDQEMQNYIDKVYSNAMDLAVEISKGPACDDIQTSLTLLRSVCRYAVDAACLDHSGPLPDKRDRKSPGVTLPRQGLPVKKGL